MVHRVGEVRGVPLIHQSRIRCSSRRGASHQESRCGVTQSMLAVAPGLLRRARPRHPKLGALPFPACSYRNEERSRFETGDLEAAIASADDRSEELTRAGFELPLYG